MEVSFTVMKGISKERCGMSRTNVELGSAVSDQN
jgi:hypothetical protein